MCVLSQTPRRGAARAVQVCCGPSRPCRKEVRDGGGRHPLHPLWEAGGLCGPSRLDRGCAARLLRAKTPVAPFSGGQRHGRQNKKRRPLPSGSHRRIVHPLICHNEEAPPQVSSQPCNSTVLAPRKPLCPNGFHVHDLPSQERCSQWRCYPGSVCCFGHLLALTVPSAVGF